MLDRLNIHHKLAFVLWGVALLAFAVAGGALLVYENHTLQSRALQIMEPYAQLISVGTEAAVSFEDPVRAREVLDSLRTNPQVLAATIVLDDGRVLASLGGRPGSNAPPPLDPSPGIVLDGGNARITQALARGGRLHLTMSLRQLQQQTQQTLWILGGGVLVLVAATLGQLMVLRRTLIRPVATLADAAQRVREGGDYAQRVPAVGSDEIARLGQSFNAMMDAVRERELELRQLTAFQRTILDNAAHGIVSARIDGIVTSFNPAAEALLGYTAAEVVGKHTPLLWHDAQELAQCATKLADGLGEDVEPGFGFFALCIERNLPIPEEWTFVRKDGRRVPVLLSLSRRLDEKGKTIGYIGLISDLTERKRAEEELQRHRHRLEELVATRTQELARSRDAAEAANRAKSEFLANMSHEIRTPMTAILGMSHLVLQSGLDAKQLNYVQKVHRAAESLLGIINDILDFSKIEAGHLDTERVAFKLSDVLDDLATQVGMRADEKGLELVFSVAPGLPSALMGDPMRVGQVLLNLGNNAVKFTDHGEIVVQVEQVARDATTVLLHFEVRDSGIGISPEHQRRLFQPFSQADSSTSRRFGGTGLGLAISSHLVRLMGGQLELDSEPGRGSRFHFTLRFGICPQAVKAKPTGPANRLHKLRTLIADDNDVARQLLVQMASSLGLDATAVADGQAALQAITQADAGDTPFELLLLDWKMQALDGVECLRELTRARLRRPPPAVLMLTTFSQNQVADRLADEQVDAAATLTKPVTPSTLLEACLQALKLPGCVPVRAERRDEAAKSCRAMLAGARILLVEDNAINQELARELLSSAGIDLRTAENGREALDWLARERFDLVLMDCQMPVMDGYDATHALRRQPQWRDLPVVAMTANAMVGDREKALAAGMNDHIAKPIDVEEPFATLARWIRRMPPGPDRSALPPLDVQAALTGLGGDRRLHRRVMQMFLKQEAGFRDHFAAARAAADTGAMARLAHDLKSVSSTLHAEGLSEAAAALESACRHGASEQEIDLRLLAVTARLDPVISALRSMPELSEA